MHPQPRVRNKTKHTSVVTTVTPEITRHSPRNGFNGFLRALPGDRACLSPSSGAFGADLTPASRRQDHTTSPSASARFVKRAARVHRIPSRVGDVRNAPLSGRDGGGCKSDLGQARSEIFLQTGLDSEIAQQPVGQISKIVPVLCHTPPSGLAFGGPDDRLQRGLQYAGAFRLIASVSGILDHPLSRVMTDAVNPRSAAPAAARFPETAAAPRNAPHGPRVPDSARR